MTNKNDDNDNENNGTVEVNTPHDKVVQKFLQELDTANNLEDEEIEASVSQVFSEGGEIMSTIAERHFDRGLNRGIDKGIDKGKWDVVMNMLRLGASIEFISQSTGFTVDQIKEFQAKLQEQQVSAAA